MDHWQPLARSVSLLAADQTPTRGSESDPPGHTSSLPLERNHAPPTTLHVQLCARLPPRSARPCRDGPVLKQGQVGSLSRGGQASVMHCGNIAWVPPEHAMQLQCTTAARQEDAAGALSVLCASEGWGLLQSWPAGTWGCASCLKQMQSPGQKERYRWSMPAPRTKQGAHLGQQAVLGQDAACLASGS